jgi:hypothetical protein
MYYALQNKKEVNYFEKLEQLHTYIFINSIKYLLSLLDINNIYHWESSPNHIFLCSKGNTDFELRIIKLDKDKYKIIFRPISGNIFEIIDSILLSQY